MKKETLLVKLNILENSKYKNAIYNIGDITFDNIHIVCCECYRIKKNKLHKYKILQQ